jgi:hypothetical protein
MQKLSDDIWAGVYQDYLSGKKLSVIFWTNEVCNGAYPNPRAFKTAFKNYIDRNKLPGREA